MKVALLLVAGECLEEQTLSSTSSEPESEEESQQVEMEEWLPTTSEQARGLGWRRGRGRGKRGVGRATSRVEPVKGGDTRRRGRKGGNRGSMRHSMRGRETGSGKYTYVVFIYWELRCSDVG